MAVEKNKANINFVDLCSISNIIGIKTSYIDCSVCRSRIFRAGMGQYTKKMQQNNEEADLVSPYPSYIV